MVNSIGLLMLVLSCDGHWIGGQSAEVKVELIAGARLPADTRLVWTLHYESNILLTGESISREDGFETFSIKVPEVRVPLEMKLICHLVGQEGGEAKPLETREVAVQVYPNDLLKPLQTLLKKKDVFVWDDPIKLPAVLSALDVPHEAIQAESGLAFQQPDICFVGANQLSHDLRDQNRILALAAAGTSVCLFCQTKPPSIAGYPIYKRLKPIAGLSPIADTNSIDETGVETKDEIAKAAFEWRKSHSLARHRSLFFQSAETRMLPAIRLPADEPILEIAYWKAEDDPKFKSPIDALVAVKTIGKGRIVFCQLPLGDWKSDPRSQLFLLDVVYCLSSPVEPTSRRSERKSVERENPEQTIDASPKPSLIDSFNSERQR